MTTVFFHIYLSEKNIYGKLFLKRVSAVYVNLVWIELQISSVKQIVIFGK
jgi:hypothetical protein